MTKRKRKWFEDPLVYGSEIFLEREKRKTGEKKMEVLGSVTQDIVAPTVGTQLTLDELRALLDIDQDQKLTKKDLVIWLKIIGESLLLGLLLSIYYNIFTIWAMVTGDGPFDWVGLIQQLVVTAVVFTYKAAKQSATNKMKKQKTTIQVQSDIIAKLQEKISKNSAIWEEIITAYNNQLFLYETDLAGKTKASKTKDQIARDLIKKYDELKEVFLKTHALPNITDIKKITP